MNYTHPQQEAINTIDQNLQIIACAGSGKTQVISQRIVNILKQGNGIKPANIVAFTYTEKAAAELKARVLKLCKAQIPEQKGLVDMYIGTIHSWCLQILQAHVYEYQKFSVLDDIKLKLFVDRNFNWIGMKDLNMSMFKDTGHFISMMGILRESELTTANQAIPPEYQDALEKYEKTLKKAAYFDFTMIMTEAHKHLVENDEFKQKLAEQIKFLIVDEYQDVNPIQEYIIKAITDLGANICVVGDDDQTIYQWRGSDINYILDFQKRYKKVKAVKLLDNFRSSPSIVDVAHRVILNNETRLEKQMNAAGTQKHERGDLLYNIYSDPEEEYRAIAEQIQKLRGISFTDKNHTRGLDYSDFCILLRTWKKASEIVKILEEYNIPFIVAGVNELLERPEVVAAHNIFLYLNKQSDKETLILLWQELAPNLKRENLEKAIAFLDKKYPEKVSFYGAFILQEIFWTFLEIAEIREENFQQTGNERLGNAPEEIIFYNLGKFSQVINDFETIHFKNSPQYKLRDFLGFLTHLATDYYPEGWLNNNFKTPNAVQIMTIFQSKGLEFPAVFIPGMNANYYPFQKVGGKNVWHFLSKSLIKDQFRYERNEEDERRLLYVAITRSQKFLFVSRSPDGKMQQKESKFAAEFSRSQYIFTNSNRNYQDRTFGTPQPKNESENILLNFSVLKNYFDCPYRFKLISFYGFCGALSPRMGYGHSIHNILMEIHKEYIAGKPTEYSDIPRLVETHVHIPYASAEILESIKNASTNVTKEYLRLNKADFDKIEFAEKEIQIDLGEGILINGRVDLVKKHIDENTSQTTILDFKSKEDAQKREVTLEQLAIYAIGYEELSGEKADFLEIYDLDKNAPFKQEIQIEDLSEMKDKIRNAAHSIRANQLQKTTHKAACINCMHTSLCSGCK